MGSFTFIPEDWKTPNTYNKNYSDPPNSSGVYLLVSPDFSNGEFEILYVGSAKSLSVRYSQHEVLRMLKKFYQVIQFYFIEIENYREVEKKMIKQIQPKFNTQWR